jgi:hypothetical protein
VKARDESWGFLRFVVLVVGAERRLDAVVVEQPLRVARVLRNDERGRGENLDRAM